MMKKAKKGDTAAAAEIEKLREAMLEYEVNILIIYSWKYGAYFCIATVRATQNESAPA